MCEGSYCDNSLANSSGSYGSMAPPTTVSGTECIDVCSCPPSCQWASCDDIFYMVLKTTSSAVRAAEEVVRCTGCHHSETVGCLGTSKSLTCATQVTLTGESLDYDKMEFDDCTFVKHSSALFAVTLFMATSILVYVIWYIRGAAQRRGRVIAAVTPVVYCDAVDDETTNVMHENEEDTETTASV